MESDRDRQAGVRAVQRFASRAVRFGRHCAPAAHQ
jgi:hypothetical protein